MTTLTEAAAAVDTHDSHEPATLRVSVDQGALLRAIRHALIPRTLFRPAIPVLAGLLLEAGSGALTVHGFDYDQHAWQRITAPGGSGRAVVHARTLRDIVAAIGARNDIRITAASDGRALTITGDGAHYTVPTLPLQDYPALPAENVGDPIGALDADDVARLARALVAVGTDPTLPVLCHVQLRNDDGHLVALSTDRFRLTRIPVAAASAAAGSGPWLVPARAIEQAARTMRSKPRRGDQLAVSATDDRITLALPDGGWSWQLLDADYPKVASLFPTEDAIRHTITVDRAALATAVRQVGVTAERNTPLRLSAAAGVLTLASGDELTRTPGDVGVADLGGARKDVPCELAGDPIVTAFNPRYLLEGLASFPDDQVRLQFTERVKPLLIRGGDGAAYLLMPVRTAE